MGVANERIRDAEISHSVDLSAYSNGVVRKMLALLNRVDADLFLQLQAALERLPSEAFTVERLDSLLFSVRMLNTQAYLTLDRELSGELRLFVEEELSFQRSLFQSTIPPQVLMRVGIVPVDAATVYQAAMSRPFQGTLLRESLAGLSEQRAKVVRDQVRIGYVEAEPIQKIVQRIRGTRAKGYADGFWEAPRRHVEAVVRTAVSHTASTARDNFFEANNDLVTARQWLSTIDLRTSSPCRLRDHLKYTNEAHPKPVGHSVPWGQGPGRLHWNCRSTSTPVLRSWKDMGFDLDELDAGTRASMDGQIGAETTYLDWLKRQSAARQDEVLGVTRGKLLRSGGLEPKDLYDNRGRYLSLDELKAKNAEAFKKANV